MKIQEITLKEIVEDIDQVVDVGTVYLYEKWTVSSKGFMITAFEDDEESPTEYNQAKYFLEVNLIKDVIEVFKDWHEKNKNNSKKACEAVIYYAVYDSYKE